MRAPITKLNQSVSKKPDVVNSAGRFFWPTRWNNGQSFSNSWDDAWDARLVAILFPVDGNHGIRCTSEAQRGVGF